MPRVTRFDDLPELVFIELFQYLSSVDILLTFDDYNHHIQQLLHERGFFRRLNLSSASLYKFDALLKRLPLTQIETLVVDVDAPSLQLTRFPYLPNLTTLRLYGVRHLTDAYKFIRRHSRSLQCLTLQTNGLFRPRGFGGTALQPTDLLETFMEDVLPRLHALRSLDLGQYFGMALALWLPTTIKCPLTYLRLPLQDVERLCKLMALKQPSSTLTELHVAIRGFCVFNTQNNLSTRLVSSKLTNLHSFSLVQSIFSRNCETCNRIDWRTIEYLTAADVMPVLRHMKLVLFITANELHRINKSALFTDDRRIDVQFAFVMQKNSCAIELTEEIPNGNRSHPRETVGVTCDLCWMKREYEHMTNLDCYYDAYREIFHVWYTLPWTFDEFFAVDDAVAYITNVEAIIPSQHHSTTIYPSQLRTLAVSQNNSSPPIMTMPHIVQLKRINTVHLSFHDWPTCLNLPNVHHVTLTNCLTVLTSFSSFPPTIRSIQLIFHARMPNLVCNDWSVLRSLPSLPKLTSLHIVFHDMNIHLDEDSCQIIAETASMLVHFGICFRRMVGEQTDPDDFNPPNVISPEDWDYFNVDPNLVVGADGNLGRGVIRFLNSVVDNYKKSIKEIHRRILNFSFRVKPVIVVEKGQCGLTAWF